jgi:hypothetical protein
MLDIDLSANGLREGDYILLKLDSRLFYHFLTLSFISLMYMESNVSLGVNYYSIVVLVSRIRGNGISLL